MIILSCANIRKEKQKNKKKTKNFRVNCSFYTFPNGKTLLNPRFYRRFMIFLLHHRSCRSQLFYVIFCRLLYVAQKIRATHSSLRSSNTSSFLHVIYRKQDSFWIPAIYNK